jgi:hypothetical protein
VVCAATQIALAIERAGNNGEDRRTSPNRPPTRDAELQVDRRRSPDHR